ncbi:hypothetical protein LTR53_004844, partial [Teratosphaeriaceae sp. CCFEE 6253]
WCEEWEGGTYPSEELRILPRAHLNSALRHTRREIKGSIRYHAPPRLDQSWGGTGCVADAGQSGRSVVQVQKSGLMSRYHREAEAGSPKAQAYRKGVQVGIKQRAVEKRPRVSERCK